MPSPKTCRTTLAHCWRQHSPVSLRNQQPKRLQSLLKAFDRLEHCRKRKSCKRFKPVSHCALGSRAFCRRKRKNGAASGGARPCILVHSIGCKRAIRAFFAKRQNKSVTTPLYTFCWMSAAACAAHPSPWQGRPALRWQKHWKTSEA